MNNDCLKVYNTLLGKHVSQSFSLKFPSLRLFIDDFLEQDPTRNKSTFDVHHQICTPLEISPHCCSIPFRHPQQQPLLGRISEPLAAHWVHPPFNDRFSAQVNWFRLRIWLGFVRSFVLSCSFFCLPTRLNCSSSSSITKNRMESTTGVRQRWVSARYEKHTVRTCSQTRPRTSRCAKQAGASAPFCVFRTEMKGPLPWKALRVVRLLCKWCPVLFSAPARCGKHMGTYTRKGK